MLTRKDLFDFMQKQIKRTADTHGDRLPQAFGRWFSNMYFSGVTSIAIPDGAGDGKVDLLVTCQAGKANRYQILNSKFTGDYDKASPVSFYDEITRYWQAFENSDNRPRYLGVVKEPLRQHFKKLFKLYDEGVADLYFVTNHKVNDRQYAAVENYNVRILHLDDLLQYVADHLEGAMPETDPLLLTGISNVLTPATNESEVPTSIVFARLIDFLEYMESDPFDLLFARNVRLWLGDTEPNRAITETFRSAPKEFAYSNNGITILCRKHTHNPGKQELHLENPRVVNGSQTLHSIRSVDNPSKNARVMVRIIEVPGSNANDLPAKVERRKDIIHKISVRSNLQNPIRRWNLVANDDFQNELARFFWDKRYYYERRAGEWKYRKLELEAVGLFRGPDIRWMTQLIAAFNYDRKGLGPAVAQGGLNALFEEEEYSRIRATPASVAFQLYLLGDVVDRTLRRLGDARRYIDNLRGYVDLSACSWVYRALREERTGLGSDSLSRVLESGFDGDWRWWDSGVKSVVDLIAVEYKRAGVRSRRTEGKDLTPANYFKNASLIKELMSKPMPGELRKLARRLRDETAVSTD